MSLEPWIRMVTAAALAVLGWWWGEQVGFGGTRHPLLGVLFFAPSIGWVLLPPVMEALRRRRQQGLDAGPRAQATDTDDESP